MNDQQELDARLKVIEAQKEEIVRLTRRAEIAELTYELYFGESYEGHKFADEVFLEYIQRATEEWEQGVRSTEWK